MYGLDKEHAPVQRAAQPPALAYRKQADSKAVGSWQLECVHGKSDRFAGGDLNALSHSFSAPDEFLGYIAMRDEAKVDYDAGELTEKVVRRLNDDAGSVLELLVKGQH